MTNCFSGSLQRTLHFFGVILYDDLIVSLKINKYYYSLLVFSSPPPSPSYTPSLFALSKAHSYWFKSNRSNLGAEQGLGWNFSRQQLGYISVGVHAHCTLIYSKACFGCKLDLAGYNYGPHYIMIACIHELNRSEMTQTQPNQAQSDPT